MYRNHFYLPSVMIMIMIIIVLNIKCFFFYLITNEVLMGQSPDERCVIINAALLGRRPQFNIRYHYHHHNHDLRSSIFSIFRASLISSTLLFIKYIFSSVHIRTKSFLASSKGNNFENWPNNQRDYVRFIEFIEILVSDKSCHKSPLRQGDKTDKTPEMSK